MRTLWGMFIVHQLLSMLDKSEKEIHTNLTLPVPGSTWLESFEANFQGLFPVRVINW